MGRWAQAERRGGGGGTGQPQAPTYSVDWHVNLFEFTKSQAEEDVDALTPFSQMEWQSSVDGGFWTAQGTGNAGGDQSGTIDTPAAHDVQWRARWSGGGAHVPTDWSYSPIFLPLWGA